MLTDKLKEANVNALKNHDTNIRNLLSVVLNKVKLAEINARAEQKTLVDADIIQILLKTQKELEEERQGYTKVGNAERVKLIEEQQQFVNEFLPKMMSEEEIAAEIEKLTDKSIPSVMKHFKISFAGKCDMRTVQAVAKRYQ